MDIQGDKTLGYVKDKVSQLVASGKSETLDHTSVPHNVQELFIHSGYRQVDSGFRSACWSLFKWHNETLNTWTHMCGLFYFLYIFSTCDELRALLSDLPVSQLLPFYAYCLAACFVYVASSGAHLFHCVSMFWHDSCFLVDYLAIGIYGCFTGIVYYYYNYINLPSILRDLDNIYLPIILASCLLSTWAAFASRLGHSPLRHVIRTSSFSTGFIICSAPCIYRVLLYMFSTPWGKDPADIFVHDNKTHGTLVLRESEYCVSYIFHFTYLVTAASVNMSRMPERFFPGSFDIVGHSHQWFHIFIFLGMRQRFWLIVSDVARYHNKLKSSDYTETSSLLCKVSACYVVFIIALIGIIFWYSNQVTHQDKEKKK